MLPHKHLITFLTIGLAVSALVLIWLPGARRGAGEIALGNQPIVAVATKLSVVKEVPSVTVTVAADPPADGVSVGKMSAAGTRSILLEPNRQAELQALRRGIQAAQVRIDAEIDRQTHDDGTIQGKSPLCF